MSNAVGIGRGDKDTVNGHQGSWYMDIRAAEDPWQDTRSCGKNPTYVWTNGRMRSGSGWQKRIGSSLPTKEPEVKRDRREEATAKQTVQAIVTKVVGNQQYALTVRWSSKHK